MPVEQSARRFNSLLILSAGAFCLVVCEFLVATQLWSKRGLHELKFDFYLLPFLLLIPLAGLLALRRRLNSWEASGEVSSTAATQINYEVGFLVLLSYVLFMTNAPK